MTEVWRDIPGFGGRYQASSLGNIRHVFKTRKPRVLKVIENRGSSRNQCVVTVSYPDGRRRQLTVLRLVAMAFYPGKVEGKNVVHRNGLHHDNTPGNALILDDVAMGKRCGRRSRRKAVCMVDGTGEIVEAFASVTAASMATGMARQTIQRHCDRLGTRPLPDGMSFRWDNGRGLYGPP